MYRHFYCFFLSSMNMLSQTSKCSFSDIRCSGFAIPYLASTSNANFFFNSSISSRLSMSAITCTPRTPYRSIPSSSQAVSRCLSLRGESCPPALGCSRTCQQKRTSPLLNQEVHPPHPLNPTKYPA